MGRSKFFALLLSAVLLLSLCSCVWEEEGASSESDDVSEFSKVADRGEPVITDPDADFGELDVVLFQVGKADASIIRTENHVVMLDTGDEDDAELISNYLRQKRIKTIDYLIITHYDNDHIGSAEYVFELCEVKTVVQPACEDKGEQYEQYLAARDASGAQVIDLVGKDLDFSFDGVDFRIYGHRESEYLSGANDYSLGLKVVHGERSFFFAGDAMDARLSEMLQIEELQSDFLKTPEHGDFKKRTEEFIRAVNPYYAVITDSKRNPGNETTYKLFESIDCDVYSTNTGNVYIKSDGKVLDITQAS